MTTKYAEIKLDVSDNKQLLIDTCINEISFVTINNNLKLTNSSLLYFGDISFDINNIQTTLSSNDLKNYYDASFTNVDISGSLKVNGSNILLEEDLNNSFVSDLSFSELRSTIDSSFILLNNKQDTFDNSLNALKTIVESISGENLLEKLINVSGEIISLEQDFSGLRHNVQDLSGTVNNLTSKISALNDLSNVDLSFVSHTELDASFNDLKTTIDSSLNNISIDLGITTYKTTLNANDNFFTNSLINSNKTNIESKVKNLINILNNNLNLNINFNNL